MASAERIPLPEKRSRHFVLLLILIIGYQILNTSEKNLIYVGMARETAHQLGTPISSLMGWLDLLKNKSTNNKTKERNHV